MSNLFPELDIEVVKLSLTPRAGGTAVSYYFTEDYWPAGTIYSSNPACYPLLAGSPQVRRGVGVSTGIKYDVSISLFADSHLSEFGKTLLDLFQEYEVHNAYADVRYYAKPVAETASSSGATSGEAVRRSTPLWGGFYMAPPAPDGSIDAGDRAHLAFTYRGFWDTGGSSSPALTTHDDTVNIRQTLRVSFTEYDANRGILTLRCRDVYFKNKQVGKKLDSTTLTGLDDKWKGEYGATVFGQSTVSADGIAINAPFFGSEIDGSNRPVAKLFSGWTYPNHPNKAFKRLLVRNQYTDQNSDTWLTVELESDPQTAGEGESVSTPVADPPNWPRDLTRYRRGIVTSPAADAAKILTATRAYIKANNQDRCADIVDGQYFFCAKNPDVLSRGDDDFSIELWVNFDLLHSGSASRIICQQGSRRKGKDLEWQVYFNTADDKIRFGISSAGATITDSVAWSSSASTGTWYQVVCRHDEAANAIKINVNAGTTVTTSSTSAIVDGKEGYFTIGARYPSDPSFDGKFYLFRYWSRVLTDGDVLNLYNSGVPLRYEDANFTDQLKVDMTQEVAFNDPFGIRDGAHGSMELTSNNNTSSVSPEIAYAYCSATSFTPSNKFGDLNTSIFKVKELDSGNSASLDGSVLRKGPVDITTSGFTTGSANVYFQIDPPLVMAPEADYMTVLDMENAETNTYFCLCSYDSNAGSTHYALDKRTKKERDQPQPNWEKQTDVRLDLEHYYLGQGDDGWEDSTGEYSYQHLEAKSIDLADGQSHLEFAEKLEFKICISGLADDGSGTYTGSANAVIEKPGHIVKFILMNEDFGLGLTSDDVYTSTIATAVSTIEAAYPSGLKMQIVIDKATTAEELIVEICRQARMIFYKTRDGKLALHAPTMHTSVDAAFSEANDRGDLDLVAVSDNDYAQVVNDFRQFYLLDPVNQPSDIANIRRNPKEKLANELFITADGSTAGDGYYSSLCSLSQELYGLREHTAPLSYYDSATYAQPVQNYFCARYSTLQRRVKIRVPRRDYFDALDIFSAIRVTHTGIPDADGTTLKGKAHDTGTPYPAYDEGVPVLVWAGGTLEGHVVEVEEQGQWIAFTIETVSPFV